MSDAGGLGNAEGTGDEGAGEGNEGGTSGGLGTEGGEGKPKGNEPTGPQIPENWKEALPEDLRGEKSLEKFKTVDGLLKSYIHMEKSFGKNKVVIPDKFATEEDWNEVYRQLGTPAESREYELKLEKDAMFNEGFVDEIKVTAQKAGLNNRQLQHMVDFIDTKNKAYMQKANDGFKAQNAQDLADLRVEWGNGYDRKLNEANTALNHFGGARALEAIQDVGLHNNKFVIKMLAGIGEAMKEDKIAHNAEQFSTMTPEEAIAAANEIRSNPEHPYNKKGHGNHAKAVAEVDRLYNLAYAKRSS